MGPELFDFAFKEYSREWAFKRPMPADFFRVAEEASGMDLDWFFGTAGLAAQAMWISLKAVTKYMPAPKEPDTNIQVQQGKAQRRTQIPIAKRK